MYKFAVVKAVISHAAWLFFVSLLYWGGYMGAVQAQVGTPYQISGSIVASGDVESFRISPDGQTVVYIADQDVHGVNELYSVPITGGVEVKLNQGLIAGGDVVTAFFAADSTRVVYKADQEQNGVFELYSVPIVGGPAVKLNSPLATGERIRSFSVTRTGTHLIYSSVQNSDTYRLYSVPITGGVVNKLTPIPLDEVWVFRFKRSPDGAHVVYSVSDDSSGDNYELYSVPIVGGTPIRLDRGSDIGGGEDARFFFLISPDSNRVVYTIRKTQFGPVALYSIPINGGDKVKIKPDEQVYHADNFTVRISPDSTRVIYETYDSNQIYSVPITGGARVRLFSPQAGEYNSRFSFSPDSERLVFVSGVDRLNSDIYSVAIAGGTAVKLNQDSVSNIQYSISLDSERLVFVSGVDQFYDIYSVAIAGGTAVKLNQDSVSNTRYLISPDSEFVIYYSSEAQEGQYAFFQVPIAGGQANRFNTAAGVSNVSISLDGTRVRYLAYQELYSVVIDSGTVVRLGRSLDSVDPSATLFRISADGNYVVFLSDQQVSNQVELFAHQLNPFDDDFDGVYNSMDNCPQIANANQADFDGDGLGDVCDLDDDGDGLPDSYEIANGLDPRNPFDRDADKDMDGFSNFDEFYYGSNPSIANTDNNNNGIPDQVEAGTFIVPTIILLLEEEV